MQKKWKDEMLSDDQLAGISGGSGVVGEVDITIIPEWIQCIGCGKIMSRAEFLSTQQCPDCGGGVYKTVQGP